MKVLYVKNDHHLLSSIFNKPWEDCSARVQKVRYHLADYNLVVEYVPGKFQLFVDALSRNPVWEHDDTLHGYKNIYEQECQVISCNKVMMILISWRSLRKQTRMRSTLWW